MNLKTAYTKAELKALSDEELDAVRKRIYLFVYGNKAPNSPEDWEALSEEQIKEEFAAIDFMCVVGDIQAERRARKSTLPTVSCSQEHK